MLYKISYIRFASVFICLAWTTVQRSSKYLFVHLEGQLLEFCFSFAIKSWILYVYL